MIKKRINKIKTYIKGLGRRELLTAVGPLACQVVVLGGAGRRAGRGGRSRCSAVGGGPGRRSGSRRRRTIAIGVAVRSVITALLLRHLLPWCGRCCDSRHGCCGHVLVGCCRAGETKLRKARAQHRSLARKSPRLSPHFFPRKRPESNGSARQGVPSPGGRVTAQDEARAVPSNKVEDRERRVQFPQPNSQKNNGEWKTRRSARF